MRGLHAGKSMLGLDADHLASDEEPLQGPPPLEGGPDRRDITAIQSLELLRICALILAKQI